MKKACISNELVSKGRFRFGATFLLYHTRVHAYNLPWHKRACMREKGLTFVPTKCSCSIAHMTHEHTHPLQSSPLPSHCSRHSARLRPYLLSCLQRLLLLHRQERPVRHSYCCPWQTAERSKAGTTAKTFICFRSFCSKK